ncbi:hypothetical protein Tco_1115713, partial [Tanacetum coccineum]
RIPSDESKVQGIETKKKRSYVSGGSYLLTRDGGCPMTACHMAALTSDMARMRYKVACNNSYKVAGNHWYEVAGNHWYEVAGQSEDDTCTR